jgi:uncharacterized protein YbjQ (UPF0145 family)
MDDLFREEEQRARDTAIQRLIDKARKQGLPDDYYLQA